MKNFLHGICGFPGDFTIQNRQAKCIEYIKERVGEQKVLVINYAHYSPSIEFFLRLRFKLSKYFYISRCCYREELTLQCVQH